MILILYVTTSIIVIREDYKTIIHNFYNLLYILINVFIL